VKWKDNVIKNDSSNNLTIYNSNYGNTPSLRKGSEWVQSGSDYLYFTREGAAVMNLRTREKITVTGDTSFNVTNATLVVDTTNESNTGSLSAIVPVTPGPEGNATLTIKNQSFSDLQQVEWQGTGFASNTVENALSIGNTVSNKVNAGSGYIYFKRKSNPAFARTQEVIIIDEGETIVFTFTDNTLIVEANNPGNTGTLRNMTTTVVFFDDAEGELQNYAERKGSAYYAEYDDLPNYNSSPSYNYYHPPYNGTGKSIAVGGYPDAKLRLSLNLNRKARLSFRYANRDYYLITDGGAVSIDGDEKAAWQGDYNWGSLEYTLEAGSHEIEWTKNGYNDSYYSYRTYLSLDNILVFYIE
jgi:hypothetical protein